MPRRRLAERLNSFAGQPELTWDLQRYAPGNRWRYHRQEVPKRRHSLAETTCCERTGMAGARRSIGRSP